MAGTEWKARFWEGFILVWANCWECSWKWGRIWEKVEDKIIGREMFKDSKVRAFYTPRIMAGVIVVEPV